jgi:hypothetical protein
MQPSAPQAHPSYHPRSLSSGWATKADAMKQLPRTGVLVIAFLLALPAAAAPPREVRLQGPNGDSGTCPDAAIADDDHAPAPQAHKRASASERAKATPTLRSGDGGNTARPRWHSILPGMFR